MADQSETRGNQLKPDRNFLQLDFLQLDTQVSQAQNRAACWTGLGQDWTRTGTGKQDRANGSKQSTNKLLQQNTNDLRGTILRHSSTLKYNT